MLLPGLPLVNRAGENPEPGLWTFEVETPRASSSALRNDSPPTTIDYVHPGACACLLLIQRIQTYVLSVTYLLFDLLKSICSPFQTGIEYFMTRVGAGFLRHRNPSETRRESIRLSRDKVIHVLSRLETIIVFIRIHDEQHNILSKSNTCKP